MKQDMKTYNPKEPICHRNDLIEGKPVIIRLQEDEGTCEVILGCFNGEIRAWRNRCRHIPIPLDWGDGEVMDDTGRYFLCRNHGAHFRITDGLCVLGPCQGRFLHPIEVRIVNDQVLLYFLAGDVQSGFRD